MKKQLLFLFFLLTAVTALNAQHTKSPQKKYTTTIGPSFKSKKIVLLVPSFLPGIMKDSSASLRNDTLVYDLNGQLFDNGYKLFPGKGSVSLSTPWQTLMEMTDAYSKKDTNRIIALYAADSKEKIKAILSGNQAGDFLDYVSKASHANLTLLGGIHYKNGFMAYTKDDVYGLHENFIIKENNKYKLAALDDKSPTGWNIAIYFKDDPKPMVPLKNISLPDSLQIDDSATVKITLPEAGRWVAIYLGNPGESVSLNVQDNGMNDYDPMEKQVALHLKGGIFIAPGTYTFYISSFNYLVRKISKDFFSDDAKHTITIY